MYAMNTTNIVNKPAEIIKTTSCSYRHSNIGIQHGTLVLIVVSEVVIMVVVVVVELPISFNKKYKDN